MQAHNAFWPRTSSQVSRCPPRRKISGEPNVFNHATQSEHTYDIDELAELELDADAEHVGRVDDGAHQLVVVGQQVVVEALGVGVAGGDGAHEAAGRQPPEQRAHQLSGSGMLRKRATQRADRARRGADCRAARPRRPPSLRVKRPPGALPRHPQLRDSKLFRILIER